MNLTRRSMLTLLGMGGATGLAACQRSRVQEQPSEDLEPTPVEEPPVESEPEPEPEPEVDYREFEDLAIDMDAWNYDEIADCYYQLGLPYCLTPGSEQYETMAIFVPGPYFVGTKSGRSYRCELAEGALVGNFTARTAPVAMPLNTPGFGAQACPTTYSSEGLSRYLEAGIIYVYAGFRGRSGGYESTTQEYFSGGSPWLSADVKAAIRCLRYNAGVLPGDFSRVFVFGQAGGGSLAATLGTSGNDPAFDPYLASLGAATHDLEGNLLSDEVYGSASWCPLISLGAADAAYEWMMGQYASDESRAEGTWTAKLSRDLSQAYGSYLNDLGLVGDDGNPLTLDKIDDGTYGAGSYYDALIGLVSEAAADFFERTEFPYTEVPALTKTQHFPGDSTLGTDLLTDGSRSDADDTSLPLGVRQVQATVYDSVESYIASLNGTARWLTYNARRRSVDVTSLWSFVERCRPSTHSVCAYDLLDRSGVVNQLFGTDNETSLHFDAIAARLIEDKADRYAKADGWDKKLVSAFRGDLAETDVLDVDVAHRVAMSDPLHYLLSGEEETSATIAPHWRINTGLFQAETTLVGEANLAFALAANEAVEDVSFTAVWGAGLELAERSGDAQDNLISWMCACCPAVDSATVGTESDAAEGDEEQENS